MDNAETFGQVQQVQAAQETPQDPGFITVRVGTLPGRIRDFVLNGGRMVRQALGTAGFGDGEGYEVRVNTTAANLDTPLTEGDTVLLVRKIRGN